MLIQEADWWVAGDDTTGVTSQGRTRETDLENLDEALAGFHGEGTRRPKKSFERRISIPKRMCQAISTTQCYSTSRPVTRWTVTGIRDLKGDAENSSDENGLYGSLSDRGFKQPLEP